MDLGGMAARGGEVEITGAHRPEVTVGLGPIIIAPMPRQNFDLK
jgi:hypothetical protein